MAALYREVVLMEKPVQSQDGFIPLVRSRSRALRGRRLRSRWLGIKSSTERRALEGPPFGGPLLFVGLSARGRSL